MTKLNFVCKKCGEEFESDVGKISSPVGEERPHFEKNIVCPRCGSLSMDETELTELGQTRLTEVFMSKLEK